MKIPFLDKLPFGRAKSESPFRDDISADVRAAAERQVARFAKLYRQIGELTELNSHATRSYDASITTKYNADMKGTYGSANAEIVSGDYTVVARSRSIAKDTPQGKAIVRTYANNVVGDDPFKLDMRYGKWTKGKAVNGEAQSMFVEDDEINRAIEAEWEIFGQPDNFTIKGDMSRMEAWRIMESSVVRDGFVLQRNHSNFPLNSYGFAVELLERDRLQTQFMGKSDAGNPIRFSIEYDKRWNRPVAYWLLNKHPGDVFGQSNLIGGYSQKTSDGMFRERIDADEIILFNNLRDRAEQDVGFTELDASVQSLWRLFQYEKALTYAAIASCMKPFWIKKTFPTGMQFTADDLAGFFNRVNNGTGGGAGAPEDISGGDANPVARQQQGTIRQRQSTEMPGSTIDMDYGLELMQTDPKFPIEAAHEFRQDNQRDIAVASGVSYQDVSGDFQNLGFAAALMCQTPKQDYCKIRQRNFIDTTVRRTFRQWLRCTIGTTLFEEKYGVNLSITELESYVQAAKWKGKRWAFVNPLVQAQTLIIMMEANILSPQQVQDQLPDGVSVETLYTLIAEAKREAEKQGISVDTFDVTRPTISKGEPGQTVPDPLADGTPAQPTAKTKPTNPVRKRNKSRISPEVLSLIDQQGDGTHRNGRH